MKKGLILEGRVLDDRGKPVGNAIVSASLTDPTVGRDGDAPTPVDSCEPEGVTDEKGRFRFSNLGPHEYTIIGRTPGPGSAIAYKVRPSTGKELVLKQEAR